MILIFLISSWNFLCSLPLTLPLGISETAWLALVYPLPLGSCRQQLDLFLNLFFLLINKSSFLNLFSYILWFSPLVILVSLFLTRSSVCMLCLTYLCFIVVTTCGQKYSALNPVLVMLLEQDQFNLTRILICVFILDVALSHKKYQRSWPNCHNLRDGGLWVLLWFISSVLFPQ